MDDLLATIFASLFPNDTVLKALFALEGQSNVVMRGPAGDGAVVYPVLVVSGKKGNGALQGESGERFSNGTLTVATYIRDDAEGNSKNDQMWQIANQASYLITGDVKTGKGGLLGARLTDAQGNPSFSVTACRPIDPNGPMPDSDPKVRKHLATYRIQLCRAS